MYLDVLIIEYNLFSAANQSQEMVVTKLQRRHRVKVQIQKIRRENHQQMKNSSIYSANQSKRMTHRLKKKVILVENLAANQNRSQNLLRVPAKNLVIAEVSLPIVQVVIVTKVPVVNHLQIHLTVGILHQKVLLQLYHHLPRAKKVMIKKKKKQKKKKKPPPRKKRN